MLVDDARAQAARLGANSMRFTVGPGVFDGADDDELRRRDASTVATIDVVALDLSEHRAGPVMCCDETVTATCVDGPSMLSLFEDVSRRAWGFAPPVLADLPGTPKSEWPGMYLGHHRGRLAGAGGYALVDGVARLWGAAVLEEFRGRGVYLSLIHI